MFLPPHLIQRKKKIDNQEETEEIENNVKNDVQEQEEIENDITKEKSENDKIENDQQQTEET